MDWDRIDNHYSPDEYPIEWEQDICDTHGIVNIVKMEEDSTWNFDAVYYCTRYYWSCGCTFEGNHFREGF